LRDFHLTGVLTCALPLWLRTAATAPSSCCGSTAATWPSGPARCCWTAPCGPVGSDGMTPFKYLQGYPPHLQQQVLQMVAENRLGGRKGVVEVACSVWL